MSEMSYTAPKPSHSLAIVSLILGILGLLSVLPVIGPVGALIAGYTARKEIQQHSDQYNGENLAQAGIILGWIGIAVSILLLTVICLGILFFIPVYSQTSFIQ